MQTQFDLFKKLASSLGEDTANDLITYIIESKEKMDEKFLIQTDKADLIKAVNEVRVDLTKAVNEVRVDLNEAVNEVRVDLTKEIYEIRKLIDTNFKWGVGMFISILITLFVLLFKSFV